MTFLLIVTISSMLLAALMSVIAWRIAAEERRRSEARIAALAAEIHASTDAASISLPAAATGTTGPRRAEIGLRGEPARLTSVGPRQPARWDEDLALRPDRATRDVPLFTGVQAGEPRSRLATIAIVGALVVAGAAAGILVASRSGRGTVHAPVIVPQVSDTSATAPDSSSSGASGSALTIPLELLALGHERTGDTLVVRGVVRNPAGGAAVDPLAVVVFALGDDGGSVATGRTPVGSTPLAAGAETPFVVTIPGAAGVARYRVSFRTGDRVVPHVDRRGPGQS
jgi:hypothetical protein